MVAAPYSCSAKYVLSVKHSLGSTTNLVQRIHIVTPFLLDQLYRSCLAVCDEDYLLRTIDNKKRMLKKSKTRTFSEGSQPPRLCFPGAL